MFRVAQEPISIPSTVTIEVLESVVTVKGPLGQLSYVIPPQISVEIQENSLLKISIFEAAKKDKKVGAQAGTFRSILYNYVKGVSDGFSSTLVLVKVGANAQIDGDYLVLKIGYSDPKRYYIREGIRILTPSPTEIVIKGIDLQKVNQAAAEIIRFRPPEVYKGTGILRKGQRIKLKAAKKK